MKPIPYGRQCITELDKESVLEALDSDFLTQGPKVEEFEKKFAFYVNAPMAIAVSNGTTALHLAVMALNLKPGDKVLVTPNTFAASANCVRYVGADVEFVDIDPNTYCMDLQKLEKKLNNSDGTYKGIIVVDFAGYPMPIHQFRELANKHKLWIIEDSCHAPGAEFLGPNGDWHKTGSCEFSDVSIFSFHPVKHIATAEGGMVTTRNKTLYEKIRLLRSHGITKDPAQLFTSGPGWYHEMQELGYNYRIPDLLCALGISQLAAAPKNLARRREVAGIYDQELAGLYKTPFAPKDKIKHAYHLYVIQDEKRDHLYQFLRERNILTQVHYIPVYRHPYYERLLGKVTDCPVMDEYYSKCLSIPLFPSMTNEELSYVVSSLKEYKKV